MEYRVFKLVAVAILGGGPAFAASPSALQAVPPAPEAAPEASEVLPGDWIVEEEDNVCGLKDARQLRNPAVVDYDALIEATAEWKTMKRKGIDKDSPEGQVMFNKAVDRVRTAAADHMKAKGFDSIWKQIKHRRGLKATDVTDDVKALVEKSSGGVASSR